MRKRKDAAMRADAAEFSRLSHPMDVGCTPRKDSHRDDIIQPPGSSLNRMRSRGGFPGG
ncbi:hypothetical protein L1S32_00655 [Methanogenium sp. S4BF]|uniref:hypothetical protein n=1 Tax=Methanogenium sp. S4BF TaxID=1789226 RepID=UPI002415EEC8|nr:hypothetical protein [Methanogenium sp. S4BF]WFN34666.1 hypothetical protein L1S32_00655 [Methanogenium sp. S4BF]